jgi:NAD(P)-dependent dehydrogenase (short-subunit alcohol dehydrogenase family)
MIDFRGKVALVTGGAKGIGRGTALMFAQAGADVVVVDIDGQAAEQAGRSITELGAEALVVEADVSSVEGCTAMIEAVMSRFGHLDVLFNNAGIGGGNTHLKDLPVEDWDHLIATNLRSVFLGCKFGLPALIASGGGAIVNMGSSTGGWDVLYGAGAYMASKEGIEGITKNLALEAAPYGVRVNAVCPGIIETRLSSTQGGAGDQAAEQAFYERFKKRIPLRRLGQPEDVAGAVLFLASDLARHITGTTLLIDGGQTLQSWSNAPEGEEYPRSPAAAS